jgi:hypothetical protein
MKADLNTTMTDSGQVSPTGAATPSTKRPGATSFCEPQKRGGHPGDHMWSPCDWFGGRTGVLGLPQRSANRADLTRSAQFSLEI